MIIDFKHVYIKSDIGVLFEDITCTNSIKLLRSFEIQE